MHIYRFLPNFLTALRIFLAPIILVFFFDKKYPLAFVLFFVAVTTDYADGFLARKWNVVSFTGKILDPFADKVLLGSILTSLWMKGIVFSYVYWSIVIRDVTLLIGACVFYWKKIKIFAPCMASKISTTLQSIMGLLGFFSVLFPDFFYKQKTFFMIISYCVFCTTVWSFFFYGRQAYHLWRKQDVTNFSKS